MNKGKLKLKYFLIGLGITVITCYFSNSLSFSLENSTLEFNNIEALASEEGINPKDYCKQAGGICIINAHNIVIGLQIEDKVK